MKEVIGADFTIHPCLANALRPSASHSKQTEISPYLTKTITKLTVGVTDIKSTGEFIKIVN